MIASLQHEAENYCFSIFNHSVQPTDGQLLESLYEEGLYLLLFFTHILLTVAEQFFQIQMWQRWHQDFLLGRAEGHSILCSMLLGGADEGAEKTMVLVI